MAYDPQTWTDFPATTTPITAARLAHIESGIDAIDAAMVSSTTVEALWMGTQAAYDALTPDATTLYFITDAA